jgi:hypothetical protein
VTIIWKKTGPIQFVAKAWGMQLSLDWLPQEQRWVVTVDGRRTRQRWTSAAAAIDACDAVADRALRDLGTTCLARQGAPSPIKVPLGGLSALPWARRSAPVRRAALHA